MKSLPSVPVKWDYFRFEMRPMKYPRTLFSLLLFALTGCVVLNPDDSASLAAAAAKYSKVTKEMNRAEVLAAVGEPSTVESLALTWRVEISPHNYESLRVEFTGGDAIVKITRVSKRFSSTPWWQTEHQVEYAK